MTRPALAPSPGIVAQDSVEIERMLTQLGAYYRLGHSMAYEASSSRSELGGPISGGGDVNPVEDMIADQRRTRIREELCRAAGEVQTVLTDLRERMVDLGLACGIRVKDWDVAEVEAEKRARRRRGPGPKHGRRIR